MKNRGKDFERKFKEDFLSSFNNSFLIRLPDQLSGYKGTSSNLCDFIAFYKGNLYLLEVKSHYGNTWPFSNFHQYDKLCYYVGQEGIRVGVILWMIDHDKVVYLPVKTVTQMKKDNKKSFNILDLNNSEYRILDLISTKKRIFLDTDYSLLTTLQEGE